MGEDEKDARGSIDESTSNMSKSRFCVGVSAPCQTQPSRGSIENGAKKPEGPHGEAGEAPSEP